MGQAIAPPAAVRRQTVVQLMLLFAVVVALAAFFGFGLGARLLFRDLVRRKFSARLRQINRGLQRGGWTYLLSLRLAPVVPFVLVNLLFGVTDFPARRFWWVSQLGMLPATLVFVNAGTQLGGIRSLSGILSPGVLVSLLLLAVLPLAARAVSARLVADR